MWVGKYVGTYLGNVLFLLSKHTMHACCALSVIKGYSTLSEQTPRLPQVLSFACRPPGRLITPLCHERV
jgi:hypothetical protein